MLHTNSDLHNQSKLGENFNYSSVNLTHSFNLYNNLKYPTSTDKNLECCVNIDEVDSTHNVSLSNEGAKVIVNDVNGLGLDGKRNRKRRVVNVVRTFIEVTTSHTRRYLEATAPSLPSQLAVTMERRRKPGETGSSAPLLNYIFDTYTNTHQHHKNEK